MHGQLSDLEAAFRTATRNVDKVSFTITAIPGTREELLSILALARTAGRQSGTELRRIELPFPTPAYFGDSFHDIPVVDTRDADVVRLFFAREPAELDAAA
ncbi:MAG: hypothetical protein NVSMB26_04160 [Beijerinckiaceae bacterium]